ncbi:hypothetical protein C8J57DRAFT_1471841 [Mycena rebaudengoi]|nr:hypothetical protein C8J57DRAFT_1471841 [Mycena rebaudengoi]
MSIPPTATVSRPSTGIPPDRLANLILTSKTVVAAAELLPFPYLKGALGPVIPILEAVQKMAKNREDFTELCASIVEIITLLQEEISRHGADAASRLTQFCDQLKNLLQEIEQGVGKLHKSEKRGFRTRFTEFGRSTSIADQLNKYKSRVHQLQLNFMVGPSLPYPLPPHTSSQTASMAQLSIHGRPSAQPTATTVCPPPSRIFQGRRDILDKMHEYFAQDIGKRHVCLLHGLGGSGKTQIALKFLHETPSDRFTDVFFIDASTADTIQAGLKNIALTRSLGSDHEDASLWLASCTTEWLLTFDNADDPKLNLFNFFPQSTQGNILITSRNPQLRVHAPGAHYRISDLEEEAAVELLLAAAAEPATSENEVLATAIVKVLHYFPLAVVQAGSLRQYLAVFEQNHSRLLSEIPVQSHDKYAWSVYTTWDISFKCLSKQAARFLQLCSFLHHEGISEAIFSNAALYSPELLEPTEEQIKEPRAFLSHFLTADGMWDTLSFADMAAEVKEYSLINQDPNTGLFSIHPLVHSWARSTVADLHTTKDCTAVLLAMSVSQQDMLFTMRLLPHITTILQANSPPATEFLYTYQRVHYDSGNFQKAQELCDVLLEKAKPCRHYYSLGRLTEAEALDVVVLEKRKQCLGPEHPDTLTSMADLTVIYGDLGRLTDAEELGVLVLEKRRQTMDAEELEVVVLEKRRQTLGPEHPDTLLSMGNLADTYRGLGKLTDAEDLQAVLLEKRRQTLGPEHPHTLLAMGHLAATYRGLGRFADAEELEVVVLEQLRQTFGPEHPETLLVMGNLANTYWGLGKLTKAEELEVVVLEKRRQTLGPEHSETLLAMGNLAKTYRGLGKLTDAEELQGLGRFTDAEELEVVVLEKLRQTFGPEHPETLLAMGNIAITYRGLGKLTDAEQFEVVVLEQRKHIFGPEHLHTLIAMENLATTSRDLGKFTEAKQLFTVAVEVRTRLLGPMHSDTILAQQDLLHCQNIDEP